MPLLNRASPWEEDILDIDSAISKLEDLFEETVQTLTSVKHKVQGLEQENQELREALGDVEVTLEEEFDGEEEKPKDKATAP